MKPFICSVYFLFYMHLCKREPGLWEVSDCGSGLYWLCWLAGLAAFLRGLRDLKTSLWECKGVLTGAPDRVCVCVSLQAGRTRCLLILETVFCSANLGQRWNNSNSREKGKSNMNTNPNNRKSNPKERTSLDILLFTLPEFSPSLSMQILIIMEHFIDKKIWHHSFKWFPVSDL